MTDLDESRLEQLIGVHSSQTSYYAQWRGTRRDLERALAALRSVSEALCVTALGPVPLCAAVLDAVGRLFEADWAVLVLNGQGLPAAGPSRFTWSRQPAPGGAAPPPEESATLAARVGSAPRVLAAEGAARRGTVLGVPMRLDRRQVGTLLMGMPDPAGPDRTGMAILETVANQIMAALRCSRRARNCAAGPSPDGPRPSAAPASWPCATSSSAGPGGSSPGPARPRW